MTAGTASWLIPLIVGSAGAGVSAYASSKAADKQRKAQQAENAADRGLTEEQDIRRTALAESQLDPFRQQMAQQKNLAALDFLQGYNRRSITPPSNVAPYAGGVGGGFAGPSDRMRSYAGLAFDDIAAGHTAPTMTKPANYGKTSALDLISLAAGKPQAQRGAGVAEAPLGPITDYFAGYQRRNEGAGGVGSGAKTGAMMGASTLNPAAVGGGAVIGGIIGAFTKNAKTAMTDFSLADAKSIISNAYQQELGRPASQQDVDTHLQNIGWKPGHKWVGEQGMVQILNSIRGARGQAAA